jgi:ABC-type lipoprotein release transport system permease subunit
MQRIAGFITARLRSAGVIATISFRNLVRQFRRNVLLGIGIAVGMCILVVTSSFTSGLTDILFNKVLVYMTGHISVKMSEYTSRRADVIRDRPRFTRTIQETVEGVVRIEEVVSAFGRTIGNGKTGLAALVGIPQDSEFYDETQLEEGNPRDIFKPDVFPGIILYKNAAKDINVRMNDIVTVRFETVYGQSQAPKFKVVGIIPSENMFMDMAAFMDIEVLRGMLNLKPDECLGLNIVVSYPQDAGKVILQADRLHQALAPGVAGVKGRLDLHAARAQADLFALRLETDPAASQAAADNLRFLAGDLEALALAKDGIILSEPLARRLGADIGERVRYHYTTKYTGEPVEMDLAVRGIVEPVAPFAESTAFVHEDLFYRTFFWNIPAEPAAAAREAPLAGALLSEWELLERSPTTDDATKKQLRLNRESWKGAKVDVQTMFENASMVVDFQKGLNTVSIVAVLILFFVILIGVVNTMRMSIRERTREIGTNRAIGMQRADVRAVFVLEIVILAFAACLAGILLSFALMGLLSSFTIDLKDNPFSMFFVNRHLYFFPTALSIAGNFITIVLVAFVIAFFTARRAARLRVADALRHYE